MSASTEKKVRQAAREAGTDKKSLAAQEEAKKKAQNQKRWTWALIGIAVLIVLVLVLNSSLLYTKTTAVTIDGRSFSPSEVTYNYANQYQTFVNNYGNYTSIFGLDTSYGLSGLSSQQSAFGEGTWRDYFLDQAVNAMKQNIALGKYAAENGIELTDEEKQEAADSFASLEETAKSYGYGSADKFIAANYGIGNNVKKVQAYALEQQLASKVYNQVAEETSDAVTLEEIKEQYPSVAVRHILVKAEAAEDGTYTDEAKEAAKAKAEEILAEWEAGDKTEESFAALAEEYSEDPGSSENGGLYDDVMQGQMVEEFDAFCFDENRQPGDTGIVYGESGSYAGYHVMYFVGEGDPADNETGRSNIAGAKMSEWLTSLTDGMDVSYKFFYRLAGKTA
ncbi:MAG: peptidylprolyl isomerase [Oscillospiraceae bacterium]|nr:peptidylprolyl isomerase [Oscillospiraceae bacterium]